MIKMNNVRSVVRDWLRVSTNRHPLSLSSLQMVKPSVRRLSSMHIGPQNYYCLCLFWCDLDFLFDVAL